MPWNELIGTEAELRTQEWLTREGFQLINQNWRCCHGEVDIIASFSGQLHFIAVATKACPTSGLPVQPITRKRMLLQKRAAQRYLERHPRWEQVIFDVLTIEIEAGDTQFILVRNIRTV